MSSPRCETGVGDGEDPLCLEGPADKGDVDVSRPVVVGGPIKYGRSCAGRSELLVVVVVEDCEVCGTTATVSALRRLPNVVGESGLIACAPDR